MYSSNNRPALIDTHAHLDMRSAGNKEQMSVIKESLNRGLSHIVLVSTDIDIFLNTLDFVNRCQSLSKKVSLAVGLGPDKSNDTNLLKFKKIIKKRQICAIGEIGLDYYWNYATPEKQIKLFEKQIEIALELNLPIIVHNREADEDIYRIIKKYPQLNGVIHCFSSNVDFAEKIMDLNFYISFAGNLTYKNAKNIQNAAKIIPMDKIVLETDSPYLSPIPKRGKTNKPWHIIHTAEYLSNLKDIPIEEVCNKTTANAVKLFNLEN